MKYKIKGMNTGDKGEKIYTLLMFDGEKWLSVRPTRYYKTMKTATTALKKLK